MSAKLGKFAPITVVAGLLGYLCWPYLDEPVATPKSKGTTKTIETLTALLSPPTAPDLDRDPFATANAGNATVSSAAPAASVVARRAATATAASRQASGLGEFVLNGTCIQGDFRMAVINGSLFAEGEQVPPAGKATAVCSLERVDVDRVVLKLNGKTTELSYSAPLSKPAADSKATPPAMAVANAPQENRSPPLEGEVRTGSQSVTKGPEPNGLPSESPAGGPHGVGASPAEAANNIPGKAN